MLYLWIGFAAIYLLVSFAVHVSTFIGLDPMSRIPGLMLLHVLIFPPFLAAIFYANRAIKRGAKNQQEIMGRAPKWLTIISGCFFAYALINFVLFLILMQGGTVFEEDGQYTRRTFGREYVQITESEFNRYNNYVARGFSGHWMVFASASLVLLVGVLALDRDNHKLQATEASATPTQL
ncbi:MAG: hypothetical protein AAGK09_12140 [Planctomycetota bacterium]